MYFNFRFLSILFSFQVEPVEIEEAVTEKVVELTETAHSIMDIDPAPSPGPTDHPDGTDVPEPGPAENKDSGSTSPVPPVPNGNEEDDDDVEIIEAPDPDTESADPLGANAEDDPLAGGNAPSDPLMEIDGENVQSGSAPKDAGSDPLVAATCETSTSPMPQEISTLQETVSSDRRKESSSSDNWELTVVDINTIVGPSPNDDVTVVSEVRSPSAILRKTLTAPPASEKPRYVGVLSEGTDVLADEDALVECASVVTPYLYQNMRALKVPILKKYRNFKTFELARAGAEKKKKLIHDSSTTEEGRTEVVQRTSDEVVDLDRTDATEATREARKSAEPSKDGAVVAVDGENDVPATQQGNLERMDVGEGAVSEPQQDQPEPSQAKTNLDVPEKAVPQTVPGETEEMDVSEKAVPETHPGETQGTDVPETQSEHERTDVSERAVLESQRDQLGKKDVPDEPLRETQQKESETVIIPEKAGPETHHGETEGMTVPDKALAETPRDEPGREDIPDQTVVETRQDEPARADVSEKVALETQQDERATMNVPGKAAPGVQQDGPERMDVDGEEPVSTKKFNGEVGSKKPDGEADGSKQTVGEKVGLEKPDGSEDGSKKLDSEDGSKKLDSEDGSKKLNSEEDRSKKPESEAEGVVKDDGLIVEVIPRLEQPDFTALLGNVREDQHVVDLVDEEEDFANQVVEKGMADLLARFPQKKYVLNIAPSDVTSLPDPFYDTAIGKFFVDIGSNLVKEYVVEDRLTVLRHKVQKKNVSEQEDHEAIESGRKALEVLRERNREFRTSVRQVKFDRILFNALDIEQVFLKRQFCLFLFLLYHSSHPASS
jgi:hypothetical protein